jgi:hypothetical protein
MFEESDPRNDEDGHCWDEGGWDSFESERPKPPKILKPKEEWLEQDRYPCRGEFETWKKLHSEVDWKIGTKSNTKIDGEYTYTNYRCASHSDCDAQVMHHLTANILYTSS